MYGKDLMSIYWPLKTYRSRLSFHGIVFLGKPICANNEQQRLELQRFTEIVSYRDTFSNDMRIVS